MCVCCECCVLSGRGLCDELITRPEESYRLCRIVVCDREVSTMRRPWPTEGGGRVAPKTNKQIYNEIKKIVTGITLSKSNVNYSKYFYIFHIRALECFYVT